MDKVQFPVIFGFREVAVGNDVFDARSGVQMSVVVYSNILITGGDIFFGMQIRISGSGLNLSMKVSKMLRFFLRQVTFFMERAVIFYVCVYINV